MKINPPGLPEINWFNVNAAIGKTAFEKNDFPTPETLIEHMNYLGIDRSLVYSVEARDWSPVNGNKRLLQMIIPYSDRLFPSFVLSPTDLYEYGTVDFLLQKMISGQVRNFRLCPKMQRFSLRQLEFVMERLSDGNPAYIVSARELNEPDYRDLEELARKFLGSTFLIIEKMWGRFNTIIDLMKRCQNVCIDTSWLHMRDIIEIMLKLFSAERLFFGIGFACHGGAAQAVLNHAGISTEQREQIAHNNLERLLLIKPQNKIKMPSVPLHKDKPLMLHFLRGGKLDTIPVVDVHAHQTGAATRGWIRPDPDLDNFVDDITAHMDRHGVDTAFVTGATALYGDPLQGNREFEEATAAKTARIRGWFAYHPLYSDELPEKVLDTFFQRGFFIGFKILPVYIQIPIGHPGWLPMFAYAEKHHLPILIHTQGDMEDLKNIAPNYPHAKFILGHTGLTEEGRLQSEQIGKLAENTYFEFSGTFVCKESMLHMIRKFSPQRFLWGSDTGNQNQAFELGLFLSLPLPDSELIPMLSENFEKILAGNKSVSC